MRHLTVIDHVHGEDRRQGSLSRGEPPAPLAGATRPSIADVLAHARAMLGPRHRMVRLTPTHAPNEPGATTDRAAMVAAADE